MRNLKKPLRSGGSEVLHRRRYFSRNASSIVAVIGDSANLGSIALHKRFGFELVGTLQSVGFKFGRSVDTPILQRALRASGQ